jgi:hypothetical protein
MEYPKTHLSLSAMLAAGAAVLALAGAPALAQEPGADPQQQPQPEYQPQPPAPGQAPGTTEVSDEQIEQFAEAYSEVAQLRDSYTQQIVQAEDPDRATELQQEANEKMIEAVEDKGLTVGEYNMIAEAMDRDPELQERVLQRLQ